MNDLYEVLQVRRGAEPEVIRAAYRALARKHHPDFGGSPERMAAINEAWAVLGDPAQRAAYDSGPQASPPSSPYAAASTGQPAAEPPPPPATTGRGLAGRRQSDQREAGTVIDFGRYAGWTVGRLVQHDPDYLEWLARTPIGRRLTSEIEAALAERATEAAALRPTHQPERRRSFTRPWATAGTPAR
jgi:curved DNA-binding protein CbpA